MLNWKHFLLKNVEGNRFNNALTIREDDKDKKFQVFEVLVTETLARMDTETSWLTFPVGQDDGIDFLGTREPISNPYLNYAPQLILGQVKRRTDGYRADSFRYDILKIVDHFETNEYKAFSLVEIIHVISSDKHIDFNNLLNSLSYNYRHYHIMPINAIDFFKYWSLYPTIIYSLLQNIFSKSELIDLVMNLSSNNYNFDYNFSIKCDHFFEGYVGEKIICQYIIQSDLDLALNLYAVIELDENFKYNVDISYPRSIIKNDSQGFRFVMIHEYKLSICFLPSKAFTGNMGTLYIYTDSGKKIKEINLGTIKINNAFTPLFYPGPNSQILDTLKKEIIAPNNCKAFSVIGVGGSGKSSIIKEAILYARNNEYECIVLSHSHDHIRPRKIICDFLMFLVNQDIENMPLYEQAYELVWEYLGNNAKPYWSETLMHYFTTDGETNLSILLEIIIMLLIMKSSQKPLFICFNDMHWSEKEALQILLMLTDKIQAFKSYFSNNVLFIFEGRDNESVNIQNIAYFPEDWNDFIKNSISQKLKTNSWTFEESANYLEILINSKDIPNTDADRHRKKKFINNILRYTQGNPFQINETIKYLYEKKYLEIDKHGYLHLPNTIIPSDVIKTNFDDTIQLRLDFYKEKHSDLIDFLIVLSHMSEYNRYSFYQYTLKKAKIYKDINSILHDMGFINITENKIVFQHEFYYQVLKNANISNMKNVYFAKNWYIKYSPHYTPLDVIALNMLLDEPDEDEIAECFGDIFKESNERNKLEAYFFSLQFSHVLLKKLNLTHSEIYYQIGIILIKIGDWKEAEKIFNEIINMNEQNESSILFKILAQKQLANVYGVSMQFDSSIDMANNALTSVRFYVQNQIEYNFGKDLLLELKRQEILILDRLAVSYWFSGQINQALPLYESALYKAKAMDDIYSLSHTLYEQGMCFLHINTSMGIDLIEQGLDLFPGRAIYTSSHEYDLICVEKLIGKIKIWSESNVDIFPADEISEIEKICKKLGIGISNYESALCHMLNGIRYAHEKKYDEAISWFYIAVDCCKMSNLETILWKSYLNIAQLYQRLCDNISDDNYQYYESQTKYFAELSNAILKKAIRKNKKNQKCIENNYQLPFEITNSLLNGQSYIMEKNLFSDNVQQPFYITIDNIIFFIME